MDGWEGDGDAVTMIEDPGPEVRLNELQALIIGMIGGAIAGTEFVEVDVEIPRDEQGNYTNKILVTGRKSGTRIRVTVDVVEE